MSLEDVIRAWKDPDFRDSLSAADRKRLPQHPAGLIELSEAALSQAAGMSTCRDTCAPARGFIAALRSIK